MFRCNFESVSGKFVLECKLLKSIKCRYLPDLGSPEYHFLKGGKNTKGCRGYGCQGGWRELYSEFSFLRQSDKKY